MKWECLHTFRWALVDAAGEIHAEVWESWPYGVWTFGARRFTSREAAERAAEAVVASRQEAPPS